MSKPKLRTATTLSKPAPAADWLKPVGTCVGVLLLLGGANLLLTALGAPPSKNAMDAGANALKYAWQLYFSPENLQTHRNFITGATLLGGALAMTGLAWGWLDPSPPRPSMKAGRFYGIGAALAVFVALFILYFGMHQIGGYDHGYMIDVAWRLSHGQKMYSDFPCTVPVSFVLGSKFALQWFGNQWRSFVDFMVLFTVPTFAWLLFLLAQLFGRSWTTLLWALAMQIISPMLVSFWTYNSTTDTTAVLFVLSATYWLRRPDDKAAFISYGAALLILATMKPNVAGVLIPGISAILFFSRPHRWKVLGVSLVAFALFMIFLWANQVSFKGMIDSYLGVRYRATSLAPFLHDLNPFEMQMVMAILACILVPVVLGLSQGREAKLSPVSWIPAIAMVAGCVLFIFGGQSKPVGEATLFLPVALALLIAHKSLRSLAPWIPVLALVASLYGFVTNSEQKLVDLPPLLVAGMVLAAEMRCPAIPATGPIFQMPLWWGRYFSLACVVLAATGLAQGVARDRVQAIGPVAFFEYDDSHTVTDGFFKGVHSGAIFDEILKEVGQVMQKAPSATVWFGPRMQWGYAAFDKPSPAREPVQWDLAMFGPSNEKDYFKNFMDAHHQLLILFKNDASNYSQDELQQMTEQYDVDQSFPLLTLLIRKH